MNFFEFAENLEQYSTQMFVNDLAQSLEQGDRAVELQKQQWQVGVDSNGRLLGRYSKLTEILSGGTKKAGDPYTLFDTGDFYAKTKLFDKYSGGDLLFSFESNGVNRDALVSKLGTRIFGLADNNQDKFTQLAQDTAIEILNTNLKLK